MSVLEGAQKGLAVILSDVFPTEVSAGRVFFPDNDQDWQQVAQSGEVFIRVHPSQLVEPGIISTFASYVDVCHTLYRDARKKADDLVSYLLAANARTPKTSIQPAVVAIEGNGYWVMNVRFVQKIKVP